MLYFETVQPSLLALLKELMELESLKNYNLVGGTALALHIGHRQSIDIDLFGKSELEADNLIPELNDIGKLTTLKVSKNIKIFEINNIKLDIVTYQYNIIREIKVVDAIRLVSKEDIGAMKLNAITGRGSKKDFVDLYFLLKDFTFKELINFYFDKYPNGSEFLLYKSMTYFDDADVQPMPEMIIPASWLEIKKLISSETNKFFA